MSSKRVERVNHLLTRALGYDVNVLESERQTKAEKLSHKITTLRHKQVARISAGRTRGAGAGGFNRDIENISHQIKIAKQQLADLEIQ